MDTRWRRRCLLLGAALVALGACQDGGGASVSEPGDDVAHDAAAPACIPNCLTRNCGADGCGGECGACGEAERCVYGFCTTIGGESSCYEHVSCLSTCGFADIGCMEDCAARGVAAAESEWIATLDACSVAHCGHCVLESNYVDCIVDCAYTECLDDMARCVNATGQWSCGELVANGCWGYCPDDSAACRWRCAPEASIAAVRAWVPLVQCLQAACAEHLVEQGWGCVDQALAGACRADYQACMQQCEPDCDGRACGSDGCGGSCGGCEAGEACSEHQCFACTPDCDGRSCGDDGCGGSCGTCAAGSSCALGQCGDEMIVVPAGPFFLGCDPTVEGACVTGQLDSPRHEVLLDAFRIDRTEVTLDAYLACMDAGACLPPIAEVCPWTWQPELGTHPVACVNWYQARDYCRWAGKRLCTEAEWEKAARGTDERLYPWGDTPASCDQAVLCGDDYQHYLCFGCGSMGSLGWGALPVGSKPAGASPYGLLDMIGNVAEWVADRYSAGSYDACQPPCENPQGVDFGERRAVRGGHLASLASRMRASKRFSLAPLLTSMYFGIRCCDSPCCAPPDE